MRKKVNRFGNRTFTVKELQDLLPKIEGLDREQAMKLANKIGMIPAKMDCLRTLLGFTKFSPPMNSYKEKDEEIIKLYLDHPGESAYSLFKKFGKQMKITDYQYFYKVLRRNKIESNRKRDFWTPIKEKKLLLERDVNKRQWKEIAQMLGKNRSSVQSHYYKLKGYIPPIQRKRHNEKI